MAKSRTATALYEAIRKVEADGRAAGGQVGGRPERFVASSSTPESPVESVGRVAPRLGAPDGGRVAGAVKTPVAEVADGRVRLALTPVTMAVGIFVLACLLMAAYAAGTRVGENRGREAGFAEGRQYTNAATLDEIQAARAQAPAPELFEGVGTSPVRRAEDRPPPHTEETAGQGWVRGYTYIVVQDFRGGDEAAMKEARGYLLDHGIETAVLPLGGDYAGRLITTQGFNRTNDPVQKKLCDDYWARIRELGAGFMKHPRNVAKYRLEGYLKTLKADKW